MAQNPATPFHDEGNSFTCQTTAAVTGKRFVSVSGSGVFDDPPLVAHSGAGVKVLGVSGYDAASGALVTVYSSPGIVMPVTAGAALTAGQEVQSDATGQAVALTTGKAAGVVLKDAASGSDAKIKLS